VEQAYLAWAGTVLPKEAIIVKTDRGDPWQTQRMTQRPVAFNVLYGIPWFMHKTPYRVLDYQQDWQSVNFNPTSFRFDLPRNQEQVDAALHLTPEDLAVYQRDQMRGLLKIWRQRGRQLFVLNADARVLAETFLPLNAYPLRGDELALKFYAAFPGDPPRALYRLVEHNDPRLAAFGAGAEEAVIWTTAPCQASGPTTVWFTGAFGERAGIAKVLVNGAYAMSFRLGAAGDATWTENGYRLEYRQQRPWWTRTEGPKFSAGTFALTVPAHVVTPRRPLTIAISPLLVTGDAESWFGVINKTDTLATLIAQGQVSTDPSSDVQHLEGFDNLVGTSEVLRRVDATLSEPTEIWLARARSEP